MADPTEVFEFNEDSTGDLTFILADKNGTPIPLANLTTLVLTLYHKSTGAIINTRTAQNVLNANNHTVHATSGLVTWSLQAADNVILGALDPDQQWPDGSLERHVAFYKWTYNAGAEQGNVEVQINIRNRKKLP